MSKLEPASEGDSAVGTEEHLENSSSSILVASPARGLTDLYTPSLQPVSLLRAVWGIMRKDMLLEWRSRARLNGTIVFALLVLLLFSFAMGPVPKLLRQTAPGLYWLAILLSSVLSLNESLRVENENAALEGLRLLPVHGSAIFLGKALVNTFYLTLISVVLVPMTVAIYGLEIQGSLGTLLLVLAVGAAGISAPGTLYAAISVQARARDLLLPLLLFPILVPALIAAVKATTLVVAGDAMQELNLWIGLLAIFACVYWFICTLLFPRIID